MEGQHAIRPTPLGATNPFESLDLVAGDVNSMPSTDRPMSKTLTLNELEKKITRLEQDNFNLKLQLFHSKGPVSLEVGGPPQLLELQQEVEDLKAELDQTRDLLTDKEHEVEALHPMLTELNEKYVELKSRYTEETSHLEEKVTQLEQDKDKLAGELEEMCKKHEALSKEYQETSQQRLQRISELESHLQKSREQERHQSELVVTAGQQLGLIMAKCKSLEETLDMKDKDIQRHRDSAKYFEMALTDLEKKYTQAAQDLQTKSELQEQLDSAHKALEDERQKTQESAAKAKKELELLRKKAEDVVHVEAEEIARLQGLLRKEERDKQQLELALADEIHMAKRHEAMETKWRQKEEEYSERQDRLVRQLEVKLKKMQSKWEAAEEHGQELEHSVKSLQESCSRLRQDKDRVDKALEEEKSMNSTLRSMLDTLDPSHVPLRESSTNSPTKGANNRKSNNPSSGFFSFSHSPSPSRDPPLTGSGSGRRHPPSGPHKENQGRGSNRRTPPSTSVVGKRSSHLAQARGRAKPSLNHDGRGEEGGGRLPMDDGAPPGRACCLSPLSLASGTTTSISALATPPRGRTRSLQDTKKQPNHHGPHLSQSWPVLDHTTRSPPPSGDRRSRSSSPTPFRTPGGIEGGGPTRGRSASPYKASRESLHVSMVKSPDIPVPKVKHLQSPEGIVHCIRSVRESFQELSRSQGEAIVTPDFIDSLSGQLLGEKVTPQAMMELMAWKGAGRGGGGNSKSSVNGDDRPGAARATPNLEACIPLLMDMTKHMGHTPITNKLCQDLEGAELRRQHHSHHHKPHSHYDHGRMEQELVRARGDPDRSCELVLKGHPEIKSKVRHQLHDIGALP